jgi:hypothetical protein
MCLKFVSVVLTLHHTWVELKSQLPLLPESALQDFMVWGGGVANYFCMAVTIL